MKGGIWKNGSLRGAANYYHDPKMQNWVVRRRAHYKNQMEFVDDVTLRFVNVMNLLPSQKRAIMNYVLLSYNAGITPTEIARQMLKPAATISAQLGQLYRHRLVAKKPKDGKRQRYYVPDRNFLRVAAIRWDARFGGWFAQKDDKAGNVVDEFITEVQNDQT